MKSWIILSISSSVMVLKRDKCFLSNKRTWRIIVQWDTLKILAVFSPCPRKSSSTSSGKSADGTWASILYCLKKFSGNSQWPWWPWYTVSKVLEVQVIQKTPLLDRLTVLHHSVSSVTIFANWLGNLTVLSKRSIWVKTSHVWRSLLANEFWLKFPRSCL